MALAYQCLAVSGVSKGRIVGVWKGLGCGLLSLRRVWQGPTHSQCKDDIIRFDKIPGTLQCDFMKEILSNPREEKDTQMRDIIHMI